MSTEFVNQMWPHALRVSQQTGLDPRLVIAQSALETGWGRSAPGNNYFGIKSHGKPGGNNLGTWEVVNGQRVNINDSFRAYDGMGASADGYAQFLMENPRYRGMLAADGLDAQIDALASSGYATDPQYGTKVRSIATGITPPSQDIADETMAVLGLSPMSNQPSAPAGRTDSTISTRGPEPMQEYQPEKAGGILGMLFPKMTADRQDSIALALSGLGRGNPALEANLRDRMGGRRDDRKEFEQQRQQQAQVNRTLQVLGQAGFDEQDLALAAENPEYMRAMVGQLAKRKLAGEQQPKWEWNSDLGQYVDMNDPTNTYAPQGAGTTPPTLDKDQMSILGGLSDDATRDLKTSEEMRSSYNRIQSFAGGQSVSDVALVTAFAKLLDPGSVVREGEAAAIAQSGSLPDAFKQSMLNALTGQGQLPPEVKQEIVSLSRKLYYDTASDARSTIEGYQGRAARAGLGDEKVYLGSEFTSPAQPQSSLRPQTRPGQFSAQQAGPTISREQLQSAVGKLSAYDRELLNSIPGAQEKLRFLQEKGVLP